MNKRERNLAVIIGGLLALVVGWYAITLFGNPLGELEAQRSSMESLRDKKQKELDGLVAAKQRLDEWQSRSLPSNVELAKTLYRDWLWELAEKKAGLPMPTIDRPQEIKLGDLYSNLRFTIRAQGTLEQVTKFLSGFYSAGHLHLIRRLSLNPVENSGNLNVVITVDALVLTGVDRKDVLSTKPVATALPAEGAFKLIAERNLFAAYAPPKKSERREPPKPDPFDPSKYAFVTGIVEGVDGRPEAWLKSRTTDELMRLHAGDPVEVGDLKGQIARIGKREVEIVVEGKPHLIPLGDNLRATESERAKTPEPAVKVEAKPPGKPEMRFDKRFDDDPEKAAEAGRVLPQDAGGEDEGAAARRRRREEVTRRVDANGPPAVLGSLSMGG